MATATEPTKTYIFPTCKAAGAALVCGILLSVILYRLPLPGWDWFWVFFENRDTATWYPPWTAILLTPIAYFPWRWGLALVNGLTLAVLGIVTYRERPGPWGLAAVVMAILSAPVIALLWDGQIDGLELFGYLLLPWGTPLLLIKPSLGAWALLARKQWIVAGIMFGAITLLLWSWWPAHSISIHVFGEYPSSTHPSSMGWYKLGWPIGVVGLFLMLFTNRKDPMHLMAAGSFLMPYIFPYHFVMLLPVLGRFTGAKQITLWLTSWTLALPFAFWQRGALLGYIFPLIVWYFIWREAPAEETRLASIHDMVQRFKITTRAEQTSHS